MGEKKEGMLTSAESDSPGDGAAEAEEVAAVRIQSVVRGGVDRRAIRAQSEAATAIQASVRSNLAKKRALAASPSSPALLDRTTVRGGLHTLGRDPHTLRPCYIACSVADKGLLGVAALKDFPLLQTLDISGNQIEDLQPLAALPFLQELDASHNSLNLCLEWSVLEGSSVSWKSTWEELEDWRSGVSRQFSVLSRVNLSHNLIAHMGDLSHHRFIQTLDLSYNKLEGIEGISSLAGLRRLNLSHNKIKRISCLNGLPLVDLNLAGNQIEEIEGIGVDALARLRYLNLANNHIEVLAPLASCTSLVDLDLSGNRVKRVRQVEWLQPASLLRSLSLKTNPLGAADNYRLRVIACLQTLTSLDGETVTAKEGIRALNTINIPGGDLANRKKEFERAFPGGGRKGLVPITWEDHLPPFVEPEAAPASSVVTANAQLAAEGFVRDAMGGALAGLELVQSTSVDSR